MPKLILLIDDDDTYNQLNHRMLKKCLDFDFEVKSFTDAGEALDEIVTGKIKPDYIFLDVNMPYFSGWEFLDSIEEERQDGAKLDFPISMLTTSQFPADKDKALEYRNVEHYINKPLSEFFVQQIFES